MPVTGSKLSFNKELGLLAWSDECSRLDLHHVELWAHMVIKASPETLHLLLVWPLDPLDCTKPARDPGLGYSSGFGV